MIIHDRATLAVSSDETTAASMTEVLRLKPTSSHEKGDSTPAARAGRVVSGDRLVESSALWAYDADESAADISDETGFRTLRVLIDALSSRVDELALLRATCDTTIWWSGDSNSTQGGFVLPVDMIRQLSLLGCDVYGTTFLDDQEQRQTH